MSTGFQGILSQEYNKLQGPYEERNWPTETCNTAGFKRIALSNLVGSTRSSIASLFLITFEAIPAGRCNRFAGFEALY
jgi:hypothetical protein